MKKQKYEVVLFEWSEGQSLGGARIVGRITDPVVVDRIRKVLVDLHHEQAERLEPSTRRPAKHTTR